MSKAHSVQTFLREFCQSWQHSICMLNGEMELGTQGTATLIQDIVLLCKLTGVMDPNEDIIVNIIITIRITEEKAFNWNIGHVFQ